MKKKFIITEDQANKILKLSEQTASDCKTLQAMPGFAMCCENALDGNPPNTNAWNEAGECKDIQAAAIGLGLVQSQWESCCPQSGDPIDDDPCKNPETANPEECWICREPGAGCLTLANAGLSVSAALNGGYNIYSDQNQCNQDEECAPIEPCQPPAGGCPQGSTWNQATCHCDPIHINDDPCNTFNQYNQINPAWGQAICKACNFGTPNAYQAQYCECCKEQCQCCQVYDDGTSNPQSMVQQVMPGNCASLNNPSTGLVNCQASPPSGGSIYCGNHTVPTQGNYLQKKQPTNKRGERKVRRR